MQIKLDKTADGRPWLLLGLKESADLLRVAAVLETEFNAQQRRRFADPLGDAAWIDYKIDGQPLTLAWDHWVGVGVIGEQGLDEPTLKQIADYFKAHPLSSMSPSGPMTH